MTTVDPCCSIPISRIPCSAEASHGGNFQTADLMTDIKTKVILVGIGGASCSGKSTLVKHLSDILPHSVIVRQDDFYLPDEMLPTLQGVDTKNWDVPSAIDWSLMAEFLQDVKRTGSIPLDRISRDDWHEPGDIPIDDNRAVAWKARFEDIKQHCLVVANIKVIWVLVEGFMLYWDQNVACQLDICIFLRLPEHILKERRETRNRKLIAAQSFWSDPEGYWDSICYPEYIRAHEDLFMDRDVENGAPREGLNNGLLLIEPEVKEKKMYMLDIVEVCLEKIASYSTLR